MTTTVDEYIAERPETVRPLLATVREAIRKALPEAEESISYGMPTYKIGRAPVIYFAAWKKHYSVYPATRRVVAALAEELAGYTVEKGTIRFPLNEPVPKRLIGRIAKLRAEESRG